MKIQNRPCQFPPLPVRRDAVAARLASGASPKKCCPKKVDKKVEKSVGWGVILLNLAQQLLVLLL